MLKRLDAKDIWVRKFDIPEFKKHKSGFTVYKVVSTVFPKNFPDGATKITVWKRYKDFKKLHKDLELMFHQLYLKGKFPPLPKDKFFGRFDEGVIEERRKSALELLEFAATHSQLFMNTVFVRFFEDGYYPKDFIDQGGSIVTSNGNNGQDHNVLVEEEDTRFLDCLIPEKVWTEQSVSTPANGISPEEPSTSPSFSHGSSEPRGGSGTTTPVLETPLVSEESARNPSNSNLIPNPPCDAVPNIVTFSDASQSFVSYRPPPSSAPSPYSLQESKTTPFLGSSTSLNEDFDSFDDEFDIVSSNENRIPNSASTLSLNSVPVPSRTKMEKLKSIGNYSGFNLFDFLPIFTKKQDKATCEQNLSDSLSSSYVREAAGHFSVAHHHESNLEYALAFEAYTEGIRILLEGAQNDVDNQRRSLVKKKVEKYLCSAENLKQILNNGLPSEHKSGLSQKKQGEPQSQSEDGFVIVENNVMPSSIDDLKNYKIVGCTFNNILIAVDTSVCGGPECFAIKVLRKSPCLLDIEKPSLIPSAIPFMVQLVKWFNTQDAIVLVLQFAAGGRLLNFVLSYQSKQILIPNSIESPNDNIQDNSSLVTESIDVTKISTSRDIGAGDSFDIPAKQPLNRQNLVSEKQDNLPFTEHTHNVRDQEIAPQEPAKMLPVRNSITSFQTEDLIENSKALLKTVSKTLEQQKTLENSSIFDRFNNLEALQEPEINADPSTSCDNVENNGGFELSETFTKLLRIYSTDCTSDELSEERLSEPVRMIPEGCLKVWAAELVIALDKLHMQGITFGNMSTHNILLGDNGHILLTYKALWNEIDTKSESNDFTAPEVLNSFGKPFWRIHPSCDWWSLGAILYFFLTGSKIQDTHSEGIHPQTIICVPALNIIGEPLSPCSRSLLVELLQFTPNLRLGYYGAEEIKSHPFFADVDWSAAEMCGISNYTKRVIPN